MRAIEESRASFEAKIRDGDESIRKKRNGKKVLGMKRCYEQSPFFYTAKVGADVPAKPTIQMS